MDRLETQNMEEELRKAKEEKEAREAAKLTSATQSMARTKIVTPGFKRPSTGKREIGTPRTRPRMGL